MQTSRWVVEALDHHVGGLDERRCGVPLLQLQFANSVCGNDCRHISIADSQDHFGEQALHADADDFACKLISTADAAEALARSAQGFGSVLFEEWLECGLGNPVMTAGSLNCL